MSEDETDEVWEDLCNAREIGKNWAKIKLAELGDIRQQEWFSAWVVELVRIAKPGSGIVIEKISTDQCSDLNDWGGVSPSWWKNAVQKYDWDVDAKSIVTETTRGQRYNLFMKKNIKR